jgi:hypothetical protein
MVKLLAPTSEKLETIEDFILSIAVRIPTSAIMPMAIIKKVKTVRSLLERMALKASVIFNPKFTKRR